MPKRFDVNKLNAKQKRRAEQIRKRLIGRGVGEDEAHKRAIEEALREMLGGYGGGKKSGGQPKKSAGWS